MCSFPALPSQDLASLSAEAGTGSPLSHRADPGGEASASDALRVPKAGTTLVWLGKGSLASSRDNIALLESAARAAVG